MLWSSVSGRSTLDVVVVRRGCVCKEKCCLAPLPLNTERKHAPPCFRRHRWRCCATNRRHCGDGHGHASGFHMLRLRASLSHLLAPILRSKFSLPTALISTGREHGCVRSRRASRSQTRLAFTIDESSSCAFIALRKRKARSGSTSISCDDAPPSLQRPGLRDRTRNATVTTLQYTVQALLLVNPAYGIPPAGFVAHRWTNPDSVAMELVIRSVPDYMSMVVFQDNRIILELHRRRPT